MTDNPPIIQKLLSSTAAQVLLIMAVGLQPRTMVRIIAGEVGAGPGSVLPQRSQHGLRESSNAEHPGRAGGYGSQSRRHQGRGWFAEYRGRSTQIRWRVQYTEM